MSIPPDLADRLATLGESIRRQQAERNGLILAAYIQGASEREIAPLDGLSTTGVEIIIDRLLGLRDPPGP